MKNIYTLIALVIFSLSAYADKRPVNTMTDWWGNWSNKDHWSLKRVPKDGDNIVVPKGYGVVMDKDSDLKNVIIDVFGILEIKSKLSLDKASEVIVETPGTIRRFGASPKTELIVINGINKYDQNSNYNITGYVIANINTKISPNGFSSTALMLPVRLTGFYATRSGANVQLSWSTDIEVNNSHFNLERSVDGSNWSNIAIVMGNNNSTTNKSYNYTDKNISSAVVYYRLRQVDMNGAEELSSVRVVRGAQENNATTVYASSKQTISVNFNTEIKNSFVVKVFTANGQKIAEQNFQSSSYKVSVNLNNATTGMYIVQISDNKEFSETKRVIL